MSKKRDDDDDDDVASVGSDRSAMSYSSEMSMNPYTKFTHPVQVRVWSVLWVEYFM